MFLFHTCTLSGLIPGSHCLSSVTRRHGVLWPTSQFSISHVCDMNLTVILTQQPCGQRNKVHVFSMAKVGRRWGNISTWRDVVEFRWDTQNTQTLPYWEYWEYMGWKGTETQCGNGPHTSVLMDINHLEIRSLFTKLSLGITLVVWIRESGSNSYQEKTRSGKHLD